MRDGQVLRDRLDEEVFFAPVSLFPLVSHVPLVSPLRVSRQFLFDAFQLG